MIGLSAFADTRFPFSSEAFLQALEYRHALCTQGLEQDQCRIADPQGRVSQGLDQDGAGVGLPDSAARSELAAIRRTREFGSATRRCMTSSDRAGGGAA